MAEIALLIGSGFSKPAGLPLAKEINDFFLRDNTEMVLSFGSGEFKWYDLADETHRHNGRIHISYIAWGILLNEFVKLYLQENKDFSNYEAFYQYVIDHTSDPKFLEKLLPASLSAFDARHPDVEEKWREDYTEKIRNFQASGFISMINHLISDLLYTRIPGDDIKAIFNPFSAYLDEYDDIDIISLNHDLILEFLLESAINKKYSDGFSTKQEILKSDDGAPLIVYQNQFEENVSLLKLHGSVDTYKYSVFEQKGGFMSPTGEEYYFKTRDYYEKQKPVRHDPETGEAVQTFHWDIKPQFITGTNKEDLITKDKMYSDLLCLSERKFKDCSDLLIIGYSFGDEHVNNILKKAVTDSPKLKKIVHINPSEEFPYETKGRTIIQLKSINDLI